jgi:hypothetical protein
MHLAPPAAARASRLIEISADVVIVGGGIAGVCAALAAARAGAKVVLAQDRPVLGGNASSEVRLWMLGATSHQGSNNRWAIEGGIIQEILAENLWRNPEGNALILDALILEKVVAEPNIRLLLNTAIDAVEKADAATIAAVTGFCAQNSTRYRLSAPIFCDASGDGIVGDLAGAAYRVGSEARSEFGEALAPEAAGSDLLGHSLYFMTKDVGKPVRFTAPAFALPMAEVERIRRHRSFDVGTQGCQFWWLEHGGRLDTVHDTETIKWDLWAVAYGVWNYIKNSGQFPEAETRTLEWFGTIPGKRESRRFEGDVWLTQQDIVEQRRHDDAVSLGGWAIDLHPADGLFSTEPGCTQWHAKGPYQIPYRTMYARGIDNLFLCGRLISASHIAFGSTRVMATCGHNAQAVGLAAATCARDGLRPRDLVEPERMRALQRDLLRLGQHIPGLALDDPDDLARRARLTASSTLRLAALSAGADRLQLDDAGAVLLPVKAGPMPVVGVTVDVAADTVFRAELRMSSKPENHTPDVTLATLEMPLKAGASQRVTLDFAATLPETAYAFVCLMDNPAIAVHLSDKRLTGVMAVSQRFNRAVAKTPRQEPPEGSGIEAFEFWIPQRRPGGKTWALTVTPPLPAYAVENLSNGIPRPTRATNAWAADFADPAPAVTLAWDAPTTIGRLVVGFDCDHDHAMESVLWGHPERAAPMAVKRLRVRTAEGAVIYEGDDLHGPRLDLKLARKVTTTALTVEILEMWGDAPAALFEIRAYG